MKGERLLRVSAIALVLIVENFVKLSVKIVMGMENIMEFVVTVLMDTTGKTVNSNVQISAQTTVNVKWASANVRPTGQVQPATPKISARTASTAHASKANANVSEDTPAHHVQ